MKLSLQGALLISFAAELSWECIATRSPDGRPEIDIGLGGETIPGAPGSNIDTTTTMISTSTSSTSSSTSTTSTTTTTTTSTTTTTTVTVCTPLGTGWLFNPANGYCYFVGSGLLIDWFGAEAACVAMGAHLTSILDQAENDFIVSITTNGGGIADITALPYIGIMASLNIAIPPIPPFLVSWTDGNPVGFTNWIIPLAGGVPLCGQMISDILPGFPIVGDWIPSPCINLIGKYVCKRLP